MNTDRHFCCVVRSVTRTLLLPALLVFFFGVRVSFGGGNDPPSPKEVPSFDNIYDALVKNNTFLLKSEFGKENLDVQSIGEWLWVFRSFRRESARFSEEYQYGLAVDSWQLGTVADDIRQNPRVSKKEWTAAITDVALDLNVKRINAERSDGIAEWESVPARDPWRPTYPPLPAPPQPSPHPPQPREYCDTPDRVTVRTTDRDGKEVSNYEVWYCLKGLINYKDRYNRFDQLSSPSSCLMAAGNYVFWTQKGSAQGSMVVINGIGADIEDRNIDLPTP